MAGTLGFERVVFVQASAYGSDNRCMLDAMREFGPAARMVVGIDALTTTDELAAMHRAGVRGVRLNMASQGERDSRRIALWVREAAERIAPLGWHVQLFTDLEVIEQLVPVIRALPTPVCVDHMGLAKGPLGTSQPGFSALRDLVASGKAWVKLSGAYRVATDAPLFAEALPIARALIEANPERVLWGTDWPHTGKHGHAHDAEPPPIEYLPLDDGHLLDHFAEAAGSDAMIERILVKNPSILYDFP